MHTCMSRQQYDLVYALGEEEPRLVYAFWMCKPAYSIIECHFSANLDNPYPFWHTFGTPKLYPFWHTALKTIPNLPVAQKLSKAHPIHPHRAEKKNIRVSCNSTDTFQNY